MPQEDNSKKIKNIAVALFVLVFAGLLTYSLFWGPLASAKKYFESYAASLGPAKTFTVSAEGKVTVSPDIATFTFSVVTQGKDPKAIATDNNTAMNAAVESVKAKGVDAKDIKTIEYNLAPSYATDQKTGKTTISGYILTQTALVKVRNLDSVADIVGGLPDLGINQIGSISFSVDDPDKALADARAQAFVKAKAKAEVMAAENGVSMGNVVNFWESSSPVPYYSNVKGLGMGGVAAEAIAPSIQPGSQEVTVDVSVTYEIK